MKYTTLIITIIVALASLTGCSKESVFTPELTKAGQNVELSLNVQNEGNEVEVIKKLRVFAFDRKSSLVAANTLFDFSQNDINTAKVTVDLKPGIYTFVVVANENEELASKFEVVGNVSQLTRTELLYEHIEKECILVQQTFNVHVKDNENGIGAQVSTNNGSTWQGSLQVELKRVAAKVSLTMKKDAKLNSNAIKIVGVTVRNIPTATPLIGSKQIETTLDKQVGLSNIITLEQDGMSSLIFDNVMLCENMASDQVSASFVEITALYNAKSVTYSIPLGKWNNDTKSYENYNVKKNTHYQIDATITSGGILVNEIIMTVMPWEMEHSEVEFDKNHSFTFLPSYDNEVENQTTILYYGSHAYFNFKLLAPQAGVWRAHLSNPLDFKFEDGFSSTGVSSAKTSTISVKPRKTSNDGAKTTLYITVNGNVIDINGDGVVDQNDVINIEQR